MANWNKRYKAVTDKSDILRSLGFAALKSDDLDDLETASKLEKLVDAQIQVERQNAEIQRGKGCCIGIFLGAAATYAGWFIGGIVKNKLNKK